MTGRALVSNREESEARGGRSLEGHSWGGDAKEEWSHGRYESRTREVKDDTINNRRAHSMLFILF